MALTIPCHEHTAKGTEVVRSPSRRRDARRKRGTCRSLDSSCGSDSVTVTLDFGAVERFAAHRLPVAVSYLSCSRLFLVLVGEDF